MGTYDTYSISEYSLSPTTSCGSPPPSQVVMTTYRVLLGEEDLPSAARYLDAALYDGSPVPDLTLLDEDGKEIPMSEVEVEIAHDVFLRVMGWWDGYDYEE